MSNNHLLNGKIKLKKNINEQKIIGNNDFFP